MAQREEEPGARLVTLAEVYAFYREYLGRDPDFATEAFPRVGNDYAATMTQIRCSQEASNWRNAHGQEPDTWCFNKDPNTGRPVPGVQPPPPQPTPPSPIPEPPRGILPGQQFIIDALWGPIHRILARIETLEGDLATRLGGTFQIILEEITAEGATVSQRLADNLTQLIPASLDLAARAADEAARVARSFVEQAASVGDVAGGFIDEIRKTQPGIIDFIFNAATKGLGPAIGAAIEKLELGHAGNTDAIINALFRDAALPPTMQDALALAPGKTTPLHLVVGGALLIGAAGSFANALFAPLIEETRIRASRNTPTSVLSPQDAAQLAIKQLRDYPAMEHMARAAGLNADNFRMLADLAFRVADPQAITSANLRGLIDDGTADRLLNRHGYDRENRAIIRQTTLQLPGVQDTIRMAVREVFNPKQRAELTLDADYPPALTGFARAIGLAEEWARNFWASHWELPSPNQVFGMLHRGLMTRQEVADYLKAADFAPVWRDRLIELAHDVFTRVDIRRIHDLRGKDHAWLVKQHKRLGYNDADAEELSVFVEVLNDDERATKRKELTGPLVSRIISGVVSGTLNEQQAGEFFTRLGYKAEAIETFMIDARLIRSEQRAERIGELLGDLYIKDRRTRLEASTQLRERGFTDGEIEERFRRWDLEKELRAPTEREEKERDLTRADIEAMYRARQLERPLALNMLTTLRYSTQEATAILDLADFREKQAEDKDRIAVVERKFKKGTVDKTAAQQQLGTIGLRATQIEASIARWEMEISQKEADLTVGQIMEVYRIGHWDDTKVRAYLARRGFDEEEISALLRLWGSKIEEDRRRAELAAQKAEEARLREAQRVIDVARRADKSLAVGQLLAAGAAGVLDWPTVKAEIVSKSYSSAEADTLIRTKQAQGVKRNA